MHVFVRHGVRASADIKLPHCYERNKKNRRLITRPPRLRSHLECCACAAAVRVRLRGSAQVNVCEHSHRYHVNMTDLTHAVDSRAIRIFLFLAAGVANRHAIAREQSAVSAMPMGWRGW